MVGRTASNVMMVAFLCLVILGMFVFHVSTGNVIFGIGEESEIAVKDFKIDDSDTIDHVHPHEHDREYDHEHDEVNEEEVDLNGTQNISRPE